VITWTHAKPPRETHPVEPRYDSTGHWVCHVCRERVNDAGRTIDTSAKNLQVASVLTADPDRPGLQDDGS
jgi:hypothetical protein